MQWVYLIKDLCCKSSKLVIICYVQKRLFDNLRSIVITHILFDRLYFTRITITKHSSSDSLLIQRQLCIIMEVVVAD